MDICSNCKIANYYKLIYAFRPDYISENLDCIPDRYLNSLNALQKMSNEDLEKIIIEYTNNCTCLEGELTNE